MGPSVAKLRQYSVLCRHLPGFIILFFTFDLRFLSYLSLRKSIAGYEAVGLPHRRFRIVWRHLCLSGQTGRQALPGHRQTPPSGRQCLLREGGGHQCAQVRCPYLPYLRQAGVGLRQFAGALQPLHQFTPGQLQGTPLQPALQHEHLLPDVGCHRPCRCAGQTGGAESQGCGCAQGP